MNRYTDRRYKSRELLRTRTVHVKVTQREFDRICRLADHDGLSVSEFMRRRALRNLDDPHPGSAAAVYR